MSSPAGSGIQAGLPLCLGEGSRAQTPGLEGGKPFKLLPPLWVLLGVTVFLALMGLLSSAASAVDESVADGHTHARSSPGTCCELFSLSVSASLRHVFKDCKLILTFARAKCNEEGRSAPAKH